MTDVITIKLTKYTTYLSSPPTHLSLNYIKVITSNTPVFEQHMWHPLQHNCLWTTYLSWPPTRLSLNYIPDIPSNTPVSEQHTCHHLCSNRHTADLSYWQKQTDGIRMSLVLSGKYAAMSWHQSRLECRLASWQQLERLGKSCSKNTGTIFMSIINDDYTQYSTRNTQVP